MRTGGAWQHSWQGRRVQHRYVAEPLHNGILIERSGQARRWSLDTVLLLSLLSY